MMPRVVKKMRKVEGDASMMEECTSIRHLAFPLFGDGVRLTRALSLCADYDMIFADDEQANKTASLKFLQLAAEWKRKVRGGDRPPSCRCTKGGRRHAESDTVG